MKDQVRKIVITGKRESITPLLKEDIIDLGCTGGLRPEPDGRIRLEAFVPSSYLQSRLLVRPDINIIDLGDAVSRDTERQREVSRQNRFKEKAEPISGFGDKV
jgi:hypothetical protein